MKQSFSTLLCVICLLFSALTSVQAEEKELDLSEMQHFEGYLPLYYDAGKGRVLLQITHMDEALLYQTALVSGVGSNDVGLDRGQLGETRIVRFRRAGPKVLLIQENTRYRALSDDAQEVRSVQEAFASSVLAGLDVVTEVSGQAVVDLTPLLFSDSHLIGERLALLEQGSFSLNKQHTAVFPEHLLNFPENTIIQILLSFDGKQPGDWVRQVTPTPQRLSVTYSHQFTALPEPGYVAREYHPRSGYFGDHFYDYAAPLEQSQLKYYLARHRLQWRDDVPADAAKSGRAWPVKEPIVYYLDAGTPEPVRSALLEGASWWADAFEAAGFADAYRVEILPADVHPLDIRYNVIQWVHRATRGWSYGSSVRDPRTGEIIKGHVTLGSLRVRQDMLIAEALTAPFKDGVDASVEAKELALARLRQLAAHEVGHTLGLSHNFAASSMGDASVMDYPHPNLYLDELGDIRLDKAYQTGVSPWDIWTIRYGYSQFNGDQEQTELQALLAEADSRGFLFISDADARVPGSSYPEAHLWDNGIDPIERLNELLAIRQAALNRFGDDVLPARRPLFELEQRLVPVYLLHRYQVQAVAKLLGGLSFDYRLKGEAGAGMRAVLPHHQKQALAALLESLSAEQLALPSHLQSLIPPPAEGYLRDREFFQHQTGNAFDHLAPARAAIALTMDELLQHQRAARMNDQHLLDKRLPDFEWVLKQLSEFSTSMKNGKYTEGIQDEIQWAYVNRLLALTRNAEASVQVRGQSLAALKQLRDQLNKSRSKSVAEFLVHHIDSNLEQQSVMPLPYQAPVSPPGSPIGH